MECSSTRGFGRGFLLHSPGASLDCRSQIADFRFQIAATHALETLALAAHFSKTPKNETSQTQRVTGRSPEQPSPKCCSRRNLRPRHVVGNGTNVPEFLHFRAINRRRTFASRAKRVCVAWQKGFQGTCLVSTARTARAGPDGLAESMPHWFSCFEDCSPFHRSRIVGDLYASSDFGVHRRLGGPERSSQEPIAALARTRRRG